MKQPPTEPRPPMMMTMKIITMISLPIAAVSVSLYRPHITPPRPASAEPAANTAPNRRRLR